jgi:hypothetical protein
MTLYSYLVDNDNGFSPNPFFGYCTLACSKPGIRRTARRGDWVIGLTPKADRIRVSFFMRVDEDPIGFDAYWHDARFKRKRPRYDAGITEEFGDNIYEPKLCGGYRQLPSMHSDGHRENPEKKKEDLSGIYVLISDSFAYFGSEPLELPAELTPLIIERGYSCRYSDDVKDKFLRYVGVVGFGVRAKPRHWPAHDHTWVNACGASACIKSYE